MGTAPRRVGARTQALAWVIRVMRRSRGYSGNAFARAAHIPQPTFNKLETGRHAINYELVAAIADALVVPLPELIAAADVEETDEPLDRETKRRLTIRALELAQDNTTPLDTFIEKLEE